MCQNNSDSWNIGSSHSASFSPQVNISDSFSIGLSLPQLQRHITYLSYGEVNQYTALLQGRMNNKHSYLCNVYSYTLSQLKISKQPQQISVLTDRMIPLQVKDWTKQNITKALHGLKRLVMIYGPFLINPLQLCRNQQGQIKVWISQQPHKCKVDYTLPNQKEMMGALAAIAQYKNIEIARIIAGCCTIRQAINLINSNIPNSPIPKKQNPLSTIHSQNSKTPMAAYRNVFELSKTQSIRFRQNSPLNHIPKISKHLQFPRSAKAQILQTTISPKKHPYFPKGRISRPVSKVITRIPVEKPSDQSFFNKSSDYLQNNRPNPAVFDYSACLQNRQSTFKPTARFATNSHFSANAHIGGAFNIPNSQRGMGSDWMPNSDGEGNNHINNYDITIINNNISNYINSFNRKSRGKQANNKQTSKTPDLKAKDPSRSKSNNAQTLVNDTIDRGRVSVPSFFALKKKHKSSHSQGKIQSQYINSCELKRTPVDNFQTSSYGPSNFNKNRKSRKLYTFSGTQNNNQPQQQPTKYFTPKNGFVLSKPYRFGNNNKTKNGEYYRNSTTQFFPSKKNLHNNNNSDQLRQKRFNSFVGEATASNQISEPMTTAKSIALPEQKPSSKRIQFKKQLKKQFGNLFNIAQSVREPQGLSNKSKSVNLVDSESKTDLMKQSILKDRIKQKQQAFAELKKQALKVLTDL